MRINVNISQTTRRSDGFAKVTVDIADLNIQQELDITFRDLYERCSIPNAVTLDLLLVASVCYVIDKSVPRTVAFDNWTREFEVTIPVNDLDLWNNVATELAQTVSFLSGDLWQFTFIPSTIRLFIRPSQWRWRRAKYSLQSRLNAVCLFSGGLDSLIGAINLLAENDDNSLLLMGHYDSPGAKAAQERLFQSIWATYQRRAVPLHIRVSHPGAANETTLRSRSLIFLALGIYAARRFGDDIPLYAPENGLIALNIPLTPSRSGSCSTRTMHPFFLNQLRMVLEKLGINNQIKNPQEYKTKGESVIECGNFELLTSIAGDSVSCSHGTRRQNWIRRNVDHCGYCIPCIIRRAALHKAGLDNGQDYGFDICEGELSIDDPGESANDLRALIDCLSDNYGSADLARLIPQVAHIDNIDQYAQVAHRGFQEIKSLFENKGNEKLHSALNILSYD